MHSMPQQVLSPDEFPKSQALGFPNQMPKGLRLKHLNAIPQLDDHA